MAWISEQVLEAIGKHAFNECITDKRLCELTRLEKQQVFSSLAKLMEHQLIERTKPGCYQLTVDGRIALEAGKPKLRPGARGKQRAVRVHKDSLRSRVWRAFTVRDKLSVPEIERLVVNGDEKNPRNNIHHYVSLLEEAGYLVKMKKKMPGTKITSNGFARWWMPRDKYTGPKAPVYRSNTRCMHDPNTGKEVQL